MVQIPVKSREIGRIDLATFLQLPETQPASEFINRTIYQKPMPKGKHSRLQKRLTLEIESVLLKAGIAEAFPELRCVFGGRAIVPDISVFQIHHLPQDTNGEIANLFEIPPDWIIEILSPDQDVKYLTTKILHCLDHGCQMGWIIDPEDRTILTYPHNDRSRCFSQAETIVPVPDWAKVFKISIGELFSWLTL